MAYYEMAREARVAHNHADTSAEERLVWQERLEDLGIRVGNALIEIGDLDGAVRHLKTLKAGGEGKGVLRTRVAMAFLQAGDVEAARQVLGTGPGNNEEEKRVDGSRKTLTALCAMADGSYEEAVKLWQDIAESAQDPAERTVAVQNMAVCMVYIGEATKVHLPLSFPASVINLELTNAIQAREVLEGLVEPHGNIGGVTYNLATLYELCSDRAKDMKMALAGRVAYLEGTGLGWDRTNAEFKL